MWILNPKPASSLHTAPTAAQHSPLSLLPFSGTVPCPIPQGTETTAVVQLQNPAQLLAGPAPETGSGGRAVPAAGRQEGWAPAAAARLGPGSPLPARGYAAEASEVVCSTLGGSGLGPQPHPGRATPGGAGESKYQSKNLKFTKSLPLTASTTCI